MGGNFYNDFECGLFEYANTFINMCMGFGEPKQEINITNNLTIINNNTVVVSDQNRLEEAIVFY